MKICQFVADLVRRSVSVGEVVVGFCSLPWCLGGSSFSIIPKLDFVGFARLARDCVEDLGGVRFILPAACVAERMVLGAWRCLVLRRRLSGQVAPSLSSPVHGVGVWVSVSWSWAPWVFGFSGSCSSSLWSFVLSLLSPFHERKLSLVLREVSWVVSYRVRGHGALLDGAIKDGFTPPRRIIPVSRCLIWLPLADIVLFFSVQVL